MPAETPNDFVRCLVVDDDPGVRDFLAAVLQRQGIRAECVGDGYEAVQRLREQWDLLFLDLNLPILGGGDVLRMIHEGSVRRPRWIALMGATRPLAIADAAEWTRGVTFLPKPFVAADIRALVDEALDAPPSPTVREVLIGGAGLWSDALARVVTRRGGRAIVARDSAEIATKGRIGDARVVVLGSPMSDADLVRAVINLRGRRQVLVGLSPKSAAAADLLAIGVAATFKLPADLKLLGGRVLELAGLRRACRRAPLLAPVLCRSGRSLHAAIAFDLSEGGLGLEGVSAELGRGIAEVQFPLSGKSIIASSRVAWVDDSGPRGRIGLRFDDLDDDARERIRDHVRTHERETTGEVALDASPY